MIPRRRYPVAAFGVAAAIGAAQVAFGVQYVAPAPFFALQPVNADVAILVLLLYTLAAHRPRRVSITGLMVCLLGSAVAITRWSPAHGAHAGGAVLGAAAGLGGVTLAAWVLGDSVAYRYRRARYAEIEARAARLEAERDAQARIAAAAERARELQEGARARSTSQRPGCAGSSVTCMTGPRSAWPRSRWSSGRSRRTSSRPTAASGDGQTACW